MGNNRIVNENVTSLESLNDALASQVEQPKVTVDDNDTKGADLIDDSVPAVDDAVSSDDVSEDTEVLQENAEETTTEVVDEKEDAVEGTVEEETEEESQEDIFSEWSDDNEETVKEDVAPDLGYADLAKEFNLEANSKEELIEGIKDKFKSDKTTDEIFNEKLSELPEDLISVVKLAKEGGDYKALLDTASVDFSLATDETLYGNAIEAHFTKDGVLDEEGLSNHLDSLTEGELRIKAGEIRNSLINQQEVAKRRIVEANEMKKEETEAGIKKALDSFEGSNGFKARPDDKKMIYESVVNDTLIKDMFYNEKGKVDYSKVSDAAFKIKNFDKITSYLLTKGKNEGKKSVVKKMTNPEVRVSSKPVKAQADSNSPGAQQAKWLKGLQGM